MDPTQFAAEPFTEKNPQAADSVEPQSGPAGPYAGPGPFPGYGAFPSYGPSPHHAPFPGYGAVSGPMCAQHAVYHAAMGSPWGPPHYMHPGMPMHGAYPHFTPAQDHGTPFAAPPDRQSGAWQNGHRSAPQTEEQRSAPPGGQTCEQGNPFPGGNPFTYNGQDPLAFAAQCCGMNPKDMGRYGQLMDLCNDFLQGKAILQK